MLRQVLLQASKSDQVRRLVETAPVSRAVVQRFVAGTQARDAVRVCTDLAAGGLATTLDHLGEDTHDLESARAVRDAYVSLLAGLAEAGLTAGGRAEVSVKLSAIGLNLGRDGEKIALEHTHDICAAATEAGTTVTLDAEEYHAIDATLAVLHDVREDFPSVGAVLQAYLRRTEADCRDLAHQGSRVRLCKGAYIAPQQEAYPTAADVDRSFVRCLKVLMTGEGYPMIATHDPRMIDIAGALAAAHRRRPKGSYEIQMLYGVRPAEQRRLAAGGESVRVYVPYGAQWYGYLMRRLAERPANTVFFLRSLMSKG